MAFVGDHEASSSSTPRCPYRVFLSFRGVDTRLTFTGHLYTALVNAGINTFKDDIEISRGEKIKSELERGIQQSSASLIVFSKDYASSRWCLDELAMILECKRGASGGHLVLPIFYDVDPTDVRRQSGSIGNAFDKYEKKVNRENDWETKNKLVEDIKRLRSTLKEAADISGMELKNEANGDESKFIQKVVSVVEDKLSHKILHVAPYLVGMTSRTRDVDLWIRDPTDHASIMVIYGIGGIGKTTIAKSVFNKNNRDFDGCSFLSNIRERSKEHKGLVDLQKQLLSDICNRKRKEIYDVDEGIYKIRDAICFKKVLIVLDDVDHLDQLNAVLGIQDSLFPGSKIILTTRIENLANPFGVCAVHKVGTLSRDDSIKLFCFHAFRQGHPIEFYMDHVRKIVSHCGGLPLGLRTLGSSLIGKKLDVWEGLLKKLETIPDTNILKKLEISYESLLDDDVKNIFLHIACFFDGEDHDYTVEILDACDMHAVVGIDHLVDRCLLEIGLDNTIMMHRLIRQMGRYIVHRESPHEPGERSRLWRSEDCFGVLTEKTGTRKTKALAFNMQIDREGNSNGMDIDSDAFSRMQQLKFLQLKNVELSGSYKEFPKRLGWFAWHGCNLECIPSDLSMERLVCLDMQHSRLIQVWEVSKSLPALKILNLSYSRRLSKSPDFSKLPKLERLILKGCTQLGEVCESIKCAKRLVLLDLEDCKGLTKLPGNISNLLFLETFIISGCSNLHELPNGLRTMKSIKVFCAERIEMSALVSWGKGILSCVSFPQFIEELSLKDCKLANDAFPKDLSNLSSLNKLNLEGNLITSLPDCCQNLSKLERLCLNRCPLLQSVVGLPLTLKFLLTGGYSGSDKNGRASVWSSSLYLSCHDCFKLTEIEGFYKVVAIRNVARGILKNLGLVELEPTFRASGLFNDVKVKYEYGTFITLVPLDELPGCFITSENTESGNIALFIVPNNPNKIQGLTLGFVFDEGSNYHLWFNVHNLTRGLKWGYSYLDVSVVEMRDKVVWLLYAKLGTTLLLQPGDQLLVEFDDVPHVKECGLMVVYNEDDDEGEITRNEFDNDKSTTPQHDGSRLLLTYPTFPQSTDFHVAGKKYSHLNLGELEHHRFLDWRIRNISDSDNDEEYESDESDNEQESE